MSWKIQFTAKAEKQLAKLDQPTAKKLYQFLTQKVVNSPYDLGKPLSANLKGLWRYRIGNYRIIVEHHQDELVVLVLKLGHRKEIY